MHERVVLKQAGCVCTHHMCVMMTLTNATVLRTATANQKNTCHPGGQCASSIGNHEHATRRSMFGCKGLDISKQFGPGIAQ
jgi:hypothetical protein